MFDTDSDDEPSLEELIETEDSDSLDEHESTSTDPSTDSDNSKPDWADSILDDTDTESEPATIPNTVQNDNDSVETLSTGTSETEQPTTPVTSASGSTTNTTEETSLVLSKNSLPTLPFSLTPSESGPDWLPRVLSGIRYVIRKLFFIIMAPVIFLLMFAATFFGYFVPGIIALYAFFGIPYIWLGNPFRMTTSGQLIWSVIFTIVFFGAVYAHTRLDEIYE